MEVKTKVILLALAMGWSLTATAAERRCPLIPMGAITGKPDEQTVKETLEAYKKRMGWSFKWVSSFGSEFNYDFHVSFTDDEVKKEEMFYNYRIGKFPSEEAPAISVFAKNPQGEVFHTYSCYARGLDMLNGAYNYMDLVPKGRDEDALPHTMAWSI